MSASSEVPPLTTPSQSCKITLLYDGDCPLCLREVRFLQSRDRGRGLIGFVNIADDAYNPAAYGGVDYGSAMARIQAILDDGTVIGGVDVFRRIYTLLGLGWIYAPTSWPILGPLVDWVYEIWAAWRLRLTGRPDLVTLITERQQRLSCQDTQCSV